MQILQTADSPERRHLPALRGEVAGSAMVCATRRLPYCLQHHFLDRVDHFFVFALIDSRNSTTLNDRTARVPFEFSTWPPKSAASDR